MIYMYKNFTYAFRLKKYIYKENNVFKHKINLMVGGIKVNS